MKNDLEYKKDGRILKCGFLVGKIVFDKDSSERIFVTDRFPFNKNELKQIINLL